MKKRPNLLAGEKLLPRPRQERSIRKAERLKSAGIAAFGAQGYENSSVEEIARRAHLPVGTFYQHFRSKRQLLLVLMDDLLEKLGRLSLRPSGGKTVRDDIHCLLAGAFSHDLRYLGAYRAWQEAALYDPDLARKQMRIHEWTTARIAGLFKMLSEKPGARKGADIWGLAAAMDSLFWSYLARAAQVPKVELDRWINSSTDLIYHPLFTDSAEAGNSIQ